MALTVPRAGLSGGSTASLQVATPDTGGALAEFGNVMKQVGDGLLSEQAEREMSRAKMSMMQGLQDLRMKWEQNGDPDALETQFPEEARAMRAEIVKGLMPRNQADAELLFDQIAFSHSSALGGKAIDLRQSQQRANLDEMGRIAIGAATTDPETSANYLAQYRADLDRAQANGTLSPEAAAERWNGVTSGSEGARMERLLTDNPRALVAAIEAGEMGGATDGEAREKWRARALAKADADDAARAQSARVARTEAVSVGRDLIKDGMQVYRTGSDFGREADIDALRKDPEAAAELAPELAEYDNARALYQTMPGFATMSLPAKKRALADAAARPKDKAYQADVVKAMQSSIETHETAMRDGNLYAYVEAVGVRKVDALPNPTDPSADLAGSLKQRFYTANGLANAGMTGLDANGKTRPAPLFTPEEKESWGKLTAKDAPPKEKARLAVALSVLGPNADRAAKELGADPVLDWITGGIGHSALAPKLALEVFEGQRALKQGEVAIPPETALKGAFMRDVPQVFQDGTNTGVDENPAMKAAQETAISLYAYRMRGKVPEDGAAVALDLTVWNQTVHEVLGGSGTFGEGDATGGIATVETGNEGYALMLPKGVSGDQVATAFRGLSDRVYKGEFGGVRGGPAPVTDQDWATLSINGRPPRAGGKPLDVKTFSSGRLRAVGGDVYEMTVMDRSSGQYVSVSDDQGAPWMFRLSEFLKAGGAE